MIGAGGLGCSALPYLAAAGVGKLGIADFDVVTMSNLHRQVLYHEGDIGKAKADVAARCMRNLNPNIAIEAFDMRLDSSNALEILAGYDVIIDGSDNFPTRYLANDGTALLGKPLVHASIYRFEGQLAVFNVPHPTTGLTINYRDLFPAPPGQGEIPNCAEAGVLGVLAGIMGTLQANEAIKIITGLGEPLMHQVLTFNALFNAFETFQIQPQEHRHALMPQSEAAFKLMDYGAFCNIEQDDILEISSQDFRDLVLHEAVTIVDVRHEDEMPKLLDHPFHSIPLPSLSDRMHELKHKENIVFICQSGLRSRRAAGITLQKFQHKKIMSVKGGMVELLKTK